MEQNPQKYKSTYDDQRHRNQLLRNNLHTQRTSKTRRHFERLLRCSTAPPPENNAATIPFPTRRRNLPRYRLPSQTARITLGCPAQLSRRNCIETPAKITIATLCCVSDGKIFHASATYIGRPRPMFRRRANNATHCSPIACDAKQSPPSQQNNPVVVIRHANCT
jgi:hypothetical protein